MLCNITTNAHAITVAVMAIVIEGQWFSRSVWQTSGPARLLPTLRRGGRKLRKLSHVRRLVRHSKIANVRLGSKADMAAPSSNVRFTPKSGHRNSAAKCPLCAKSGHYAAQQNSIYSITWSARVSTDCGIVRPSALAVFRLTTSSYFVGAWTGRSAGFSPLRMRST